MAIGVMIIGESGTGKSTSIETLDPTQTFILQVVNKPLPFKGYLKKYPLRSKEEPKGNRIITNDYNKIISAIKNIAKMKEISSIVIDDITYLMTNQYMTTDKKGFEKFTDIAEDFYNLLTTIENIEREDLVIFLLGHQQEKETGKTSLKTVGKMIDDKICVEGMLSIVLNTTVNNNGYFFNTQNNGYNTSKSPKGMFEEKQIENDLEKVRKAIFEYYEIGESENENK